MTWIMIILMVATQLPAILKIIEQAFDGIPDSSEDKKNMAKVFIKSIIKGTTAVTGPELDALLLKVEKVVDPLIDCMCSIFFPHEEGK